MILIFAVISTLKISLIAQGGEGGITKVQKLIYEWTPMRG